MRNKRLYEILAVLIIVALLSLNGCMAPTPSVDSTILTQNNSVINAPGDSYCQGLYTDKWVKSCEAYEETNPNNCVALNSLNIPYYKTDYCYYDLSVYANQNSCDKIDEATQRWECKAIVSRNISLCRYSETTDSCLLRYAIVLKDKTACDKITDNGQSKAGCLDTVNSRFIDVNSEIQTQFLREYTQNVTCSNYLSKDCETLEGDNKDICLHCSALENKDVNICLLLKDYRRANCVTNLAYIFKDSSLCKELTDMKKDFCNEKMGVFINVTACRELPNEQIFDCVISGLVYVDRNNQSNKICDIFSEPERSDCYLRYALFKITYRDISP